jgi:hypothetical protein
MKERNKNIVNTLLGQIPDFDGRTQINRDRNAWQWAVNVAGIGSF